MRAMASSSVAVALVAGLACFLPPLRTVRYPLKVGKLYSIAVAGDVAEFDLPPSDGHEPYLLVIGSLATDGILRDIEIERAEIERVEVLPLARIAVDEPRRLSARVPEVEATPPLAAARQREFWLHLGGGSTQNPATYRKIHGRLAGQGPHVRVYCDVDDAVDEATIRAIVDEYEHHVRPVLAEHLGLPCDVDGDGVLTILLTGWLSRLDDGQVSLGGMVRANDFRRELKPPFSNRADILYLNSSVRPGPHLRSLLAHELAHAVTASGRLESTSWLFPATSEEAWLNEAISHVTENLQGDNWSNLDYRIARYLFAPAAAPLVVGDYRSAGLWRDPGCRGSCYLFLRWCVDRYGVELLPRLVYSSRSGIANLESATGESFAALFRRFGVDLFLSSVYGESTEYQAASSAHVTRVDIAQPLGRWGLSGPRFDRWDLGEGERDRRHLSLAGTAMSHVVLHGSRRKAQRVRVRGPLGTKLQVSLVRLPDELALLDLSVVALPSGHWQLRIRERTGHEVQLTHVAWEAPETADGQTAVHRCLTETELSRLFDQNRVPAGGLLTSRPVQFPGIISGQLTLSVAGVDSQGHRVAAWCDVDLDRESLRLAWRQ